MDVSRRRRRLSRGVVVDAEAVRRARLEAHLSLSQVAFPSYSRTSVHLVERGRLRPSQTLLEHIAARTGQPVGRFLRPADNGPPEDQRAVALRMHTLVEAGQLQTAIEIGEEALRSRLHPRIRAEVRLWLAAAYARCHQGRSAIRQLHGLARYFKAVGDAEMMVEARDWEAAASILLEEPQAISVGEQALRECETLYPSRPRLEARILLHLSAMYWRQGSHGRALTLLRRCLDLFEPEEQHRYVAMAHETLALALHALGRLGEALDHLRAALRIYRRVPTDDLDLPRVEENLGCLILEQGHTEEAEFHLSRAVEAIRALGPEKWGLGAALADFAKLHLLRGELDKAEASLLEAVAVCRQHPEIEPLARALRWLGEVKELQGDHHGADAIFREAIDLCHTPDLREPLRQNLMAYAAVLERRGEPQRAIDYWRAAAEVGKPPMQSTGGSATRRQTAGA